VRVRTGQPSPGSDVGVRLLPPASQVRPVCGDGSAAAAAVGPRSPPDSRSVTVAAPPAPSITDRRRFCHRASLVTFKRFEGDTVWCPIETAAYDLEWPVGDLATQLFGSDGMSNG